MLRLRLLYFIFKASLLRRTLKSLTKLLIKLNHILRLFLKISFL